MGEEPRPAPAAGAGWGWDAGPLYSMMVYLPGFLGFSRG